MMVLLIKITIKKAVIIKICIHMFGKFFSINNIIAVEKLQNIADLIKSFRGKFEKKK